MSFLFFWLCCIASSPQAQDKKFELSIGGQRMLNFNMGSLVGYIENFNLVKDGVLVTYNYDLALSMHVSPKNTFTFGAGQWKMGRSSSSLGSGLFWPAGPVDIPCMNVQYTSLNVFGLYSREILTIAAWDVVTSMGIQYWRNSDSDNLIPIHTNNIAGIIKIGIKQEVFKNFNLHFNGLWSQATRNLFSIEGQSSYIPSNLGLELRFGWIL